MHERANIYLEAKNEAPFMFENYLDGIVHT